jgi:hypothetical protein
MFYRLCQGEEGIAFGCLDDSLGHCPPNQDWLLPRFKFAKVCFCSKSLGFANVCLLDLKESRMVYLAV